MTNDPLQQPREEIDAIDAEIIRLLGERWRLVEDISEIKRRHNLPPLQPGRFAEMLHELERLEQHNDLPAGMIEDIWNVIHTYSRRSQGETDAR